jgi:hypothetical protein
LEAVFKGVRNNLGASYLLIAILYHWLLGTALSAAWDTEPSEGQSAYFEFFNGHKMYEELTHNISYFM